MWKLLWYVQFFSAFITLTFKKKRILRIIEISISLRFTSFTDYGVHNAEQITAP